MNKYYFVPERLCITYVYNKPVVSVASVEWAEGASLGKKGVETRITNLLECKVTPPPLLGSVLLITAKGDCAAAVLLPSPSSVWASLMRREGRQQDNGRCRS